MSSHWFGRLGKTALPTLFDWTGRLAGKACDWPGRESPTSSHWLGTLKAARPFWRLQDRSTRRSSGRREDRRAAAS